MLTDRHAKERLARIDVSPSSKASYYAAAPGSPGSPGSAKSGRPGSPSEARYRLTSDGSIRSGCGSVDETERGEVFEAGMPVSLVRNISPTGPPELGRVGSMNVLGEAVMAWRSVYDLDDTVPVLAFVKAASATAAIFDCLGAMVSSVKADLQGNIDKIKKNVKPNENRTVMEMMQLELDEAGGSAKAAAKEGSVALAMLWGGRMLRMVARLVSELHRNPSKSLCECMSAGYNSSLAPHHPWAMRQMTAVAIRGCPSRQVFFEKLGDDPRDVEECLGPFHESCWPVLSQVQQFMVSKGFEEPDK